MTSSSNSNISAIEARRLLVQRHLDAARAQPLRNRLGQFATPAPLAEEILQQARQQFGNGRVKFLDPAIGTGSFYSALLRTWPRSRIARATGFEIDPSYASACRSLWRTTPLRLRGQDFTAAMPRGATDRYNLIICNPPYVRHHHLSPAIKRRLQAASSALSGVRMSGLAGLYAYFITLLTPWMAPGALVGWLIPCEFMDVNYGSAIRNYLLDRMTLLHIHRFEPTAMQFEGALVTSAVVWVRNAAPTARHRIELTTGDSLSQPRSRRRVAASTLRLTPRWTALFKQPAVALTGPTLGDFFKIRRGVATGANKFFIMSPEQARVRGIPACYLRAILPRPTELDQDEVACDHDGAPVLTQSRVMLDCGLNAQQLRDRHPQFWRYLQRDGRQIAQRYLCSRRTPWYSQEQRDPTFFLCSYIARQGPGGRLQRFIFNRSIAIAANSYLMLYPREVLAQFIGGDAERARLVWTQLCLIGPGALRRAGRVYGGGLYKLEPGELARVPVPGVAALLPLARI